MIEEEGRLREERRAKMKEIKENMSNGLWREGVTSAPDVREVDEFQEELSAAEKQKRRIQDKLVNGKPVPKDKLNLSVRKNEQEVIESTLESTLISEANKTRQKRLISKADEQLDADIADVFSEDTDARYGNGNSKSLMIVSEAEPEMENITEVAKRRKFNSFRETNGSRKENTSRLGNKPSSDAKMVSEFREKDKQRAQILPNKDKVIEDSIRNKNSTFVNLRGKQENDERPLSHTTKVYQNGNYQPSEFSVESSTKKSSKSGVESGDDPLSQSLPSWGIDKLKKEAKCVYDSRIFNKKEDDSNYLKSCQQESKKKDKDASFKEFLNASFNNAASITEKKTLNKVDPFIQNGSLSMTTNSSRTTTAINSIDLNLNDDNEYESITTYAGSASPTISMRTVSEFGEPDNKGHAKLKHKTEQSMMGQIQTVMGSVIGSGNGRNNENQGKSVRPSSSMSTLPEEEDLCSHCGSSSGKQKSRKWSCYSIIFLLAVDAFTIGLVLVLFSHHNYHTEFVNIDTDKDLRPEASIGRAPDLKIEKGPQPKIIEIPGSNRKFPDVGGRNARSGSGSINHGTPLAQNQVGFKILTKKLNVTEDFNASSSTNVTSSRSTTSTRSTPSIRSTPLTSSTTTSSTTSTRSTPSTSSTTSTTSIKPTSPTTESTKSSKTTMPKDSVDITQNNDEWRMEIENLKNEIALLKSPPAFACHKTESHTIEGRITYNGCNVRTIGMDANSGIFTVKVPGVYHFSFTGLFHALNGHGINAHIIWERGREVRHLGSSKADTNENGWPGKDDDLHSTSTVIIMERLQVGDRIYTKMDLDEGGDGASVLHSQKVNPSIHFVGQRISD